MTPDSTTAPVPYRVDTATSPCDIAVVGMACRLPGGAASPAELWRLLLDRVDTVREIPESRWDAAAYYHPEPGRPGKMYSTRGSFLDDVDLFDPAFFGISPREADCMDPQQRLLLELTWEALEDAGIRPSQLAGTDTSVFIGLCTTDYGELSRADPTSIQPYSGTGSALSIAANRISYVFDFHGPSIAVDTACSSSLVAVHLAVESLVRGESPVALVGGANLILDPTTNINFSRASMLSLRGKCSAFDARADGFVRAEGAGMVVLRPLAAALAAGDPVQSVIRASAVNQDGRTTGIALPNRAAQEELLRRAYAQAGISPRDVHYVEAHGTGTPAGDPVECGALGTVLGVGRAAGRELWIGSIKSNIGHCEAASGIAGLIKAVLVLRHRYLPATVNFDTPNPNIPMDALGLRVVQQGESWPTANERAVVGVNSFGFGGTSAHVVLEEFRSEALPPSPAPAARALLLPLSARSREALPALAEGYRRALAGGIPARDVCYTASRRDHHAYRLAVVGDGTDDLDAALAAYLAGEHPSSVTVGESATTGAPRIGYVFTGNGSQRWAMGRELLEEEPVFAEALREFDELYHDHTGLSMLAELRADQAQSRMARTDIAQPALLGVQLGIVALLRSWGVEPAVVAGHSVGEVAAAYASGALDLVQAIQVIHHRSRTQQRTAGSGGMAAIGLSERQARDALAEFGPALDLAAVNSPAAVSVSGDLVALGKLLAKLEPAGVFTRILPLDYAFHSAHMDGIRDDLLASLAGLAPRDGTVPMVSTVTGGPVDGRALTAEYWWHNIRRPVEFASAVTGLAELGCDAVLEIGPHPVLRSYLAECLRDVQSPAAIVATLRRETPERLAMLRAAGRLYTLGCGLAWEQVNVLGAHRSLPAYPWQRQRHWHARGAGGQRVGGPVVHPLLGQRTGASRPTYANQLDVHVLPYLADHQVEEGPVFPAAGYVEMVLAAATHEEPDAGVLVEDLQIRRPLLLDPAVAATVQLSLDPHDGVVRLDSQDAADQQWQLHIAGQVRRVGRSAAADPLDIEVVRARCPRPLAPAALYDLADHHGLRYGPRFRTVREVWSGAGETLGVVALDDAEETTGYRLHPALLDGCFQSTLPLVLTDEAGNHGAYLPVGIQRLRMYRPGGRTAVCHARVVRRGRSSMEMNLWIADENGVRVADVIGFQLQAVNLTPESRSTRGYGDIYEEDLVPLPGPGVRDAADLPAPAELCDPADLLSDYLRLTRELGRDRYHRTVSPAIDRLATDYVVQALHRAGWRPRPGDAFTTAGLAHRLGVVEQHEQLLGYLLGMLADDGSLARSESGWTVVRAPVVHDSEPDWARLAVAHPACHSDLLLLARCGMRLAEVLTGAVDPLEVLFDGQAAATLDHFYSTGALGRVYNEMMAGLVAQIVERVPADRPLRILEIGAGTGGSTGYLLPWLPPERTEYVFTDVSEAFLRKAAEQFRDYGFVSYRTLDIEQDPTGQGFQAHSFDLILASNVIHATRDLRTSLGHVHQLLASEGLTALVEITNPPRLVFVVFGLLRGFWAFTDHDLRPAHALLSTRQWCDLLTATGFHDVQVLTERQERPELSILLARGPRLARPVSQDDTGRVWVLLLDERGAATPLADALSAASDRVVLVRKGQRYCRVAPDEFEVRAGQAEDLGRMLVELGDRVTDVVHTWSLDAGAELTAGSLRTAQRDGCLAVSQLVQVLTREDPSVDPRLWLLTAGARALRPGIDPVNVAQSAIVGLRRVIGNEHPELRCTLIDLSPQTVLDSARDSGEWLAAADELRHGGGTDEAGPIGVEDEVLLRGQFRYAGRLRSRPAGSASRREPPSPGDAALVLRLGTPGVLDTLHWQNDQLPDAAPGTVVVEVAATGLNFKDVMHALNLLPAEAVERSYAGGLCLGFECAGRIVAVGQGVTGLAVGDEVIAVARNALASHVLAEADLVIRKPTGLSFEEAATMFAAFITCHYGLRWLARLRAGERLLVHHASGGVGLAAIQIAWAVGAEVFATAGSPEKREFLRLLGIRHVMDSRALDFADQVLAATGGEGVDVVLNSLTGDGLQESLRLLARFGRFIELGKQDLLGNVRVGLLPFERCLSLHAVDVDQMMLADRETVRKLMAEVVALTEDGTYRPLAHRMFTSAQVAEAFRYMQHSRHKGKVVVSLRNAPALTTARRTTETPATALRIRPDGLYVISGGLGGFGLETAHWMVKRGARHVALLGRRDLRQMATDPTVIAMRAAEAEVTVAQVDVTDHEQVRDFLTGVRATGRPVCGVVHAAMVLDDCLVGQLDATRLDRAMAPKVLGAWHLHEETLQDPLDLFVMYSSLTSVIGNTGQANYVAGNAFLDEFAGYRRALGLPALTVSWGVIAEVGYVARQAEAGDRLALRGVGAMDPRLALDTMERLLGERAVHATVSQIDWHRVKDVWTVTSPRWIGLLPDDEPSAIVTVSAAGLLRQVLEAAPETRTEALTVWLVDRVARVLGLIPSSIDPDRPLAEIGLDSLMAMELRIRIESDLGVDIPVMKLMQAKTLRDLTTQLEVNVWQTVQP